MTLIKVLKIARELLKKNSYGKVVNSKVSTRLRTKKFRTRTQILTTTTKMNLDHERLMIVNLIMMKMSENQGKHREKISRKL